MTWQGYWEEHMQGIEETEEEIDRRLLLLLLLLNMGESRIRGELRPLVARLPVLPSGRLDTSSLRVSELRARAARVSSQTSRALITEIAGAATNSRPLPVGASHHNRTPQRGLLWEGLQEVERIQTEAGRKARLLLEADRRSHPGLRLLPPGKLPPPSVTEGGGPPRPPSGSDRWLPPPPHRIGPGSVPDRLPGDTVIYPGVTLDDYRAQVEWAAAQRAGGASSRDRQDTGGDGALNVLRNIDSMSKRVAEEITRLTEPFGQVDDLRDYLEERKATLQMRAAQDMGAFTGTKVPPDVQAMADQLLERMEADALRAQRKATG